MLVYVTTTKYIERAFQSWINEAGDDSEIEQRRIVFRVYEWFMTSDDARQYHKITGLLSFPLDSWEITFRRWIEREITSHPDNEEKIRHWSEQLITLMSSVWCVEHKLVVMECLEMFDFNEAVGEVSS